MNIEILPLNEADMKTPPTEEFGFGDQFSNRMFSQHYSPDVGWHDAKIGPFEPIFVCRQQRPFCITPKKFLKAPRHTVVPMVTSTCSVPGKICVAFNNSAKRMAMATVDEEEHLAAIVKLIELEQDWVPEKAGASLYIRPAMFGSDAASGRACQ